MSSQTIVTPAAEAHPDRRRWLALALVVAAQFMVVLDVAILTTTFEEGRERNIALGVWGAASGSGGAAGVLLGGVLTSSFGWSWIFFVNIPVGLLLIVVAPLLVHESRAALNHRHFDASGAA